MPHQVEISSVEGSNANAGEMNFRAPITLGPSSAARKAGGPAGSDDTRGGAGGMVAFLRALQQDKGGKKKLLRNSRSDLALRSLALQPTSPFSVELAFPAKPGQRKRGGGAGGTAQSEKKQEDNEHRFSGSSCGT